MLLRCDVVFEQHVIRWTHALISYSLILIVVSSTCRLFGAVPVPWHSERSCWYCVRLGVMQLRVEGAREDSLSFRLSARSGLSVCMSVQPQADNTCGRDLDLWWSMVVQPHAFKYRNQILSGFSNDFGVMFVLIAHQLSLAVTQRVQRRLPFDPLD